MNTLRFTKVRRVKSPTRSHDGDAGLDFYLPTDLTRDDLAKANIDSKYITFNYIGYSTIGTIGIYENISTGFIERIVLGPHTRILIPSGLRILLTPSNSMLMAANKSGISTKKGLIYTAEIVDSNYTGEVHIGLVNTTDYSISIDISPNSKGLQFIHVPIFLTNPVEISNKDYDIISKDWGSRGSDGFGSTDIPVENYITQPDQD